MYIRPHLGGMQSAWPNALKSRTIVLLFANSFLLVFLFWHFRGIYSSGMSLVEIALSPAELIPPEPEIDLKNHYPSIPSPCRISLEWLKDLDIPFPVKYARRDIIVRSNPEVQRSSMTKIPGRLFGDLQTIDPTKMNQSTLVNCLDPLSLDVPAFFNHSLNASHILLGGATNLDRLDASLPFFQRWLANTGIRLFMIVTGPDDSTPDSKRMSQLQARMRNLGLAATLVKPLSKHDSFVERYFSLVKVLYAHRDEQTKWIGFIDDDTFFTSMTALVEALDQYDASQNHYLGALSEEWWTVMLYGIVGMGGAGIFLSLPLAEIVDAHYKECKEHSQKGFGDHKIGECVDRHTDTRLRVLPGLHQIDVHGDRSGIFESGRQILTMHHWKEGYWDEHGEGPDGIRHPKWFPMDEMSLVTDICDRCYLQRWQFGNDTVLSNGYSISTYPKGELQKPHNESRFDKLEQTWVTPVVVNNSRNAGWDHYLGTTRPALKLEEEKIPYRFLKGVAVDGGVRQYYRHLGQNGELNTLIELFWIRQDALL